MLRGTPFNLLECGIGRRTLSSLLGSRLYQQRIITINQKQGGGRISISKINQHERHSVRFRRMNCIDLFPAFILKHSFSSPPFHWIIKLNKQKKQNQKKEWYKQKKSCGHSLLSKPYEIMLTYANKKMLKCIALRSM